MRNNVNQLKASAPQIIPIPKKGNVKECSNYRTGALISHTERPGNSERSGSSSGVHGARPTLDLHVAQGLRVLSNPRVQLRADSGVSDPG